MVGIHPQFWSLEVFRSRSQKYLVLEKSTSYLSQQLPDVLDL